ncbi:mediator complex subunit 27-domain-containing protein [Aspergillus heterothallicus]
MPGSKILVLGGTGPAGICLLRELVFQKLQTIVYARNPSKIPDDLVAHELIEVIKGEMDDLETLSTAIAQSRVIISLLGPNIMDKNMSPTLFADMYKSSVFPLMRQHGVRRIFAMGTVSLFRPEDHWVLTRSAIVTFVRLFAHRAYQNIINIASVFDNDADGLDWTVFRIAMIPGNSDEESWRKDREDGETFVGPVGAKGWTLSQTRSALARWLVVAAEGGAEEWVGKMPAVLFVVIPGMDSSPTMNRNGLGNVKEVHLKDSNGSNMLHAAYEEASPEPVLDPELLESEMELVTSLAKLQKLEEMIHQLRTLLPERLLEPLAPIVNPKASTGTTVPNSPQKLFQQLSEAARGGVSEVGEFQSMWRGRDMKPVWDRIDTLVYENAGQLLQSSGMWEEDYGSLLEELTKQDSVRKEKEQRAKEELERSQLQSAEGGWKAIVDNFIQKNVPGVRITITKSDSAFAILLLKAGLSFKVNAVSVGQESEIPEWQVSSKQASADPPSKLESAVLDCLNSRSRKWDLAFLLEMISSYSNIFQTPCTKCNSITDNSANLPAIRHLKATQSSNKPQHIFEAYHATCI